MTQEGLWGPQWLLSYEANRQGWLPSSGTDDHVLRDPFFGPLKRNGVTFFDTTAPLVVPRVTIGIFGARAAIYL